MLGEAGADHDPYRFIYPGLRRLVERAYPAVRCSDGSLPEWSRFFGPCGIELPRIEINGNQSLHEAGQVRTDLSPTLSPLVVLGMIALLLGLFFAVVQAS